MDDLVKRALEEDIGTGDVTTESAVFPGRAVEGRFIAKEAGVVCGVAVMRRVFGLLDPGVETEVYKDDGAVTEPGDVIARISGDARAVLTGERVALNFLRHLSGISTATRKLADIVKDTGAKITDTRKTTPGLRVLEKYAVKTGGGSNHRFNLSDGVLVKDNHISAAGGISEAVRAVRENIPHTIKIEVEAASLQMVREALACGADIIMLDNMSDADMAEAVKLIAGRALVEASGNMGDKDILAVAKTGVDLISVGALTHSVRALDISLELSPLK